MHKNERSDLFLRISAPNALTIFSLLSIFLLLSTSFGEVIIILVLFLGSLILYPSFELSKETHSTIPIYVTLAIIVTTPIILCLIKYFRSTTRGVRERYLNWAIFWSGFFLILGWKIYKAFKQLGWL